MLTLQNLIDLEELSETYPNIKRVQYWWYGKDIEKDYIGDGILLKGPSQIRGADSNTLYLIGSGIDGYRNIYKFAIRLLDYNEETQKYDYERVSLKLDDYSGRLVLYKATKFTFYCKSFRNYDNHSDSK